MTDNPRRAAFEILARIEKEKSYADILIDRELSLGKLQGPDRGLLTELVYGVLRRQGTLDHIINHFSKQKTDKLERSVRIILRLGIYQLYYLDRVPVHAAINETVNLANSLARRAAGFVNAILRRADRERDTIVYPDQAVNPAGFIALFHSHPRWIVEQWLEQLGPEEAEALAETMSRQAPLTIRVNTLKTTRDALLARLAAEGVTAEPTRWSPYGLTLLNQPGIAALASFREGLFTVQDESSQLAVLLLEPRLGERVLDACAAPGGKATFIAQLMENRGSVMACDTSPRKLSQVLETVKRLGIDIVKTEVVDAASPLGSRRSEQFDRVLIDAPCSGLGVLRRNPEGKWWKTPEDLVDLNGKQKAIILNLAGSVADGGVMLYSTCSTNQAENEAIIDYFLSQRSDFMLEDLRANFPGYADLFTERGMFRSWPHRHGMDGFFAARLRKQR